MQNAAEKTYTVNGGPKGPPFLGLIGQAKRDPLGFFLQNSLQYGEIIPFEVMGRKVVQANHPDIVKRVLMENHKNYVKSKAYTRFESAIGKGLLTSNGDRWRQDRQKIQPMFKKEQIEGYYFDVISSVSEKYKQRWLGLTEKGKTRIDITQEMSAITTEVIMKIIFGKDNLDDKTVASLHHSYSVFMEYLKKTRLLPKVDLEKLFCTPHYFRFKKELANVDTIITTLLAQYRKGNATDKYNMLALLSEAQKENPEHFSEADIRDHVTTMIFGGFETTSLVMQWIWYALDTRADIEDKLRSEITQQAPCTATRDSSALSFDQTNQMHYLSAAIKETMRLYPPFWVSSREPVEDDYLGDYKVERGTLVILPQLVMQRHPRWWDEPNTFIPERFLGDNEAKIDVGLYFPFSHGPRKCIGYRLAEMEAKIILAKLLPLFKVRTVNSLGNNLDPGITLKLAKPLIAEIARL